MKTQFNRQFLSQTEFSSARPGGLACVVHPVADAGRYELRASDSDSEEWVPLHVAEPAESDSPAKPRQVVIDPLKLREQRRSAAVSAHAPALVMEVGGFLRISASKQSDCACVCVRRAHDQKQVFDTRRIGAGDVFAVTLVRPGRYELVDTISGKSTTVTVSYPKVGDKPYRPPQPHEVTLRERGFPRRKIALEPAQGLIVRLEVEASLELKLVEPDDGPGADDDDRDLDDLKQHVRRELRHGKKLLRRFLKVVKTRFDDDD